MVSYSTALRTDCGHSVHRMKERVTILTLNFANLQLRTLTCKPALSFIESLHGIRRVEHGDPAKSVYRLTK